MTALTSKPEAHFPLSRRDAVLGGLLLSAAAGAGALQWRRTVVEPIEFDIGDGLPERLDTLIAHDSGSVVRPAETAENKSVYDQEVSRVYFAEDLPAIMLMIAYGSAQSETLALHRPEVCYPASGFKISESQLVSQPVGDGRVVPANFFTGVRADRVEHVLYWTRMGNQFPASWASQHLARMKNSFQGVVPDGVLVRASLISPDYSSAQATLQGFLEQLTTRSSPRVRTVLAG